MVWLLSARRSRWVFTAAASCELSRVEHSSHAYFQLQDAIHSSIVATLLALMDGLDDRGQVRRYLIGDVESSNAVSPMLRRSATRNHRRNRSSLSVRPIDLTLLILRCVALAVSTASSTFRCHPLVPAVKSWTSTLANGRPH